MGALTSSELVSELQRRLTNLSDSDALAALNRACRWIARQASFEFMTASAATIAVETPTAATQTFSGTIRMKNGDGIGYYDAGDLFDTTGTWSVFIGDRPGPLTTTGHDGLTITIDGDPYICFWVGNFTGGWGDPGTALALGIAGNWPGADGTYS